MKNRTRDVLLVAALALFLVGLVLPAAGTPADQVTLCHAAGQEGTTQFVTLTISANAAFGQAGHFNEDGTPRAGHEEDYLGECVVTTTTIPEEVTTTTADQSTTTTAPAPTTTLPEVLIPTPIPEETTTTTTTPEATTTTVELTTTSTLIEVRPPVTVTTQANLEPRELPYTGLSTEDLAVLALVLALAGGVFVAVARRAE